MDVFVIKQNDTSPALRFALLPKTVVLTGATVVFNMAKRAGDTPKVNRSPAVVEVEDTTPTVRYDWDAADTDENGTFLAEFEVTYADGTVETFPNDSYITVKIARHLG